MERQLTVVAVRLVLVWAINTHRVVVGVATARQRHALDISVGADCDGGFIDACFQSSFCSSELGPIG